MTNKVLQALREALAAAPKATRRAVFDELRAEFPIHALEQKLNAPAEIILAAIDRASDLTLRGVRGIIAEAYFAIEIIPSLHNLGWIDVTPTGGDLPYDFVLRRGSDEVRIQVKNQRLERGKPKIWRRPRPGHPAMYVAETQRTRNGTGQDGEKTRPYKYGEFDILAVCLHPSTGNWQDFRYTPSRWLVPRRISPQLIDVLQPVASAPDNDWSSSFDQAAGWHLSGLSQTIWH